jgi:hypothetical protein
LALRETPDRSAEVTGGIDGSSNGADAQKIADLVVFVEHGEWTIE